MPTGRSEHTTEEQQCGEARKARQVVMPPLQQLKKGMVMADIQRECTLKIG